jgi:hypothetical protein
MQKMTQNNMRGAFFFPVVLLLPAFGFAADNNMVDCAQITDSVERLTCYDEVMQRGPATSDLPVVRLPRAPRPVASQESGAPTPAVESSDDFGLEVKNADRDSNATRTYVVASAKHTDLTGWTIEFANGQVWRQVGTEDYRIREGERYTIERGMFNSFMLGNGSNNRKIRVTRVE